MEVDEVEDGCWGEQTTMESGGFWKKNGGSRSGSLRVLFVEICCQIEALMINYMIYVKININK